MSIEYLTLIDMQKRFSNTTLGIVNAIIEPVRDGIYITDKCGNFIMANGAFERITGINRNELEGKHTSYLLDNNWVSTAVNLDVIKDHRSRNKIVRYPSGKLILVSAGMILRDNGNPAGCISTLRDLTELNELKDKLIESQVKIAHFRKKIDYLEERLDNSRHEFIAQSTEFRRIVSLAKRVARSDASVLLTGDSGVGKDVLAQFIHRHSDRKKTGTIIKVDCAALPAPLLESELFGYEKGAFTDARTQGKRGMCELAHEGTLFLDEIGELPFELQSKLLNVLQDRTIKRVGGTSSIPIDVRIISATNTNLEQMVRERKFREDLYYRLNVVPIHICPLRERRHDILPLLKHFKLIFNRKYKTNKYMSPIALTSLLNYHWPGNARELKNTIERLIVTSTGDVITFQDLPDEIRKITNTNTSTSTVNMSSTEPTGPLKKLIDDFEKELIVRTLQKHGNLRDAAHELQIDVSTLTRKNRKYGLTGLKSHSPSYETDMAHLR